MQIVKERAANKRSVLKNINWKQLILKSILAGALIAMAGWIFLSCQSLDIGAWSKAIGAASFSVGLVAVIGLQANLYTGKIGYVNSKQSAIEAFVILAVNLISAFLIGLLYRACVGTSAAMGSRLAKEWYRILVDGFFCGALIYIAVEMHKKTKSFLPVILCVTTFILGGFEHSIADMAYYGASELTWKGLGYVGLVVLGNSLGSLAIRYLQLGLFKEKQDELN